MMGKFTVAYRFKQKWSDILHQLRILPFLHYLQWYYTLIPFKPKNVFSHSVLYWKTIGIKQVWSLLMVSTERIAYSFFPSSSMKVWIYHTPSLLCQQHPLCAAWQEGPVFQHDLTLESHPEETALWDCWRRWRLHGWLHACSVDLYQTCGQMWHLQLEWCHLG